MTVYLLNKMNAFIYQNKQKIVQTLLKSLFCLNLHIIKNILFYLR